MDDQFIQIVPDKGTKAAYKMVDKWPQRFSRTIRQYVYTVTHTFLEALLDRIPPDQQYTSYRDALRLVRVAGMGSGRVGYAVIASARSRRQKKLDQPKTLLYVRPRRGLAKVPPSVAVLEKYNPWTSETLPFKPSYREGIVVARRATEREVRKATKHKRKTTSKWRAELIRVGVKVPPPSKIAAPSPKLRVVPDVVHDGMTLEFGRGRSRAIPHWRPALRELVSMGARHIAKKREFKHALMSPKSTRWRKWPTRVSQKVSIAELHKFLAFQTRIRSGS